MIRKKGYILKRIADLVWEGSTLKHISDKRIFRPYLLLLCLLILFETYQMIILFSSLPLLISFGYKPTLTFYGIGLFLMTTIVYTVMVLIETVKVFKSKKEFDNAGHV